MQLLGKTPHRPRSKCGHLRWEGAAMSEEGKEIVEKREGKNNEVRDQVM